MVKTQYLDEQTFDTFKRNQEKLIEVLNHNMTKVQVDVNWLKKGMGWMIGFMASIFLTILGILIKFVLS